tara:strand:+ start:286 stop:618 length:333 start_codon:yes stop_codon:yes gene_type:complete
MKNLFKILILSLLVFSCESSSTKLVGGWTHDKTNSIMVFYEDGTGMGQGESIREEIFLWKIQDNILSITYNSKKLNDPFIIIMKYRISNDSLFTSDPKNSLYEHIWERVN